MPIKAMQHFKYYGRRISVALIVMAMTVSLSPEIAYAQTAPKRETLFDWLFPSVNKKPPQTRQKRQQRQQTQKPQRPRKNTAANKKPTRKAPNVVRQRAAAVAPIAPVAATKLDTAKTVLVVGDFLANGMGDALINRFQSSPNIRIVVSSNGSSGLVRTDYYDWFNALPKLVNDTKPALVIAMLGSNDRQTMVANGQSMRFGSEEWLAEYKNRIASFTTLAAPKQTPLIWVGLPAFQSNDFTADVLLLNRLYRSNTENAGAEFADIWDGFADESGKFITTGFDVNGQQVRLREADGIGMTAAGKDKLAFYVERYIRRHLEDSSPTTLNNDGKQLPELTAVPALDLNAGLVRIQPINMTDPQLDGADELLGAAPIKAKTTKSPRDLLIKDGELAPAPLGRVDDYRMSSPDLSVVTSNKN